jgi:hypothetical protein
MAPRAILEFVEIYVMNITEMKGKSREEKWVQFFTHPDDGKRIYT